MISPATGRATIRDIAASLERRGIAHLVCSNGEPRGLGAFVAVPGCARILALGRGLHSPSVLWCDPRIFETEAVEFPAAGAIGGERLWFAPEGRYHWQGKPDWERFSNYAPSPAADPGNYTLCRLQSEGACFSGPVSVTEHSTGRRVDGFVRKTVRLLSGEELASAGFGIEVAIELLLEPNSDASPMDIWSIVQVPPGTRLAVPLSSAGDTSPLRYSPRDGWDVREGCVNWQFGGTESSKFGLGAAQVTGEAFVYFDDEAVACRKLTLAFPFSATASYCDHPYGIPRTDQVFQAWDGFGFGEIEVHSPAAFATEGRNQAECRYRILVE